MSDKYLMTIDEFYLVKKCSKKLYELLNFCDYELLEQSFVKIIIYRDLPTAHLILQNGGIISILDGSENIQKVKVKSNKIFLLNDEKKENS